MNIGGVVMDACNATSNTDDGFEMSQIQYRITGCYSSANAGFEWDFQASGSWNGNSQAFGAGTDASGLVTITDPLFNPNFAMNQVVTFKHEVRTFRMQNTSGGALAVGDVVVFKSVAAGDEITTTTTQGDDKVFGMVTDAIADTAWGGILTQGFTTRLKVDGTTDIAVGDLLGTFTTAGIAMKAAAGDMAFAIALEAYTTNDSAGVIDAILITPRLI